MARGKREEKREEKREDETETENETEKEEVVLSSPPGKTSPEVETHRETYISRLINTIIYLVARPSPLSTLDRRAPRCKLAGLGSPAADSSSAQTRRRQDEALDTVRATSSPAHPSVPRNETQ